MFSSSTLKDQPLPVPSKHREPYIELFVTIVASFQRQKRLRNRTIDESLLIPLQSLIDNFIQDTTPFGRRLLDYVYTHQALPAMTDKEMEASYEYNCMNMEQGGNYVGLGFGSLAGLLANMSDSVKRSALAEKDTNRLQSTSSTNQLQLYNSSHCIDQSEQSNDIHKSSQLCQYTMHYIGESSDLGIRESTHFVERFKEDSHNRSAHYIAARASTFVSYYAVTIVTQEGQEGRERRSWNESVFNHALFGFPQTWIQQARARDGLPSITNSIGVNGMLPNAARRMTGSTGLCSFFHYHYTARALTSISIRMNTEAKEAEALGHMQLAQWKYKCSESAKMKLAKFNSFVEVKKGDIEERRVEIQNGTMQLTVQNNKDGVKTSLYYMSMRRVTFDDLVAEYERYHGKKSNSSFNVTVRLTEADIESEDDAFTGISQRHAILYGRIKLTISVGSGSNEIPWIFGNVGKGVSLSQEDNAKRIFKLLSDSSQKERLDSLAALPEVESTLLGDQPSDLQPLNLKFMADALYHGYFEVKFWQKSEKEAILKYSVSCSDLSENQDYTVEDNLDEKRSQHRSVDTRKMQLYGDAELFKKELSIVGLPRPVFRLRAKLDADYGIFYGQKTIQQHQLMSTVAIEIQNAEDRWISLRESRHMEFGANIHDALLEIQEARIEAGIIELKEIASGSRIPKSVMCSEPVNRKGESEYFQISEARFLQHVGKNTVKGAVFAKGGFREVSIPTLLVNDWFGSNKNNDGARIQYKIDAHFAQEKSQVKIYASLITGGSFIGQWFDLLQSQKVGKTITEKAWSVVQKLQRGETPASRNRDPSTFKKTRCISKSEDEEEEQKVSVSRKRGRRS